MTKNTPPDANKDSVEVFKAKIIKKIEKKIASARKFINRHEDDDFDLSEVESEIIVLNEVVDIINGVKTK